MHRWAVRHPVSTCLGVVALVVLGAFSLARLPVTLLPSLERPKLVVTARAADRSREEMLHGLTEPLEQRLASLPDVSDLRSETEDGLSRVVVTTGWGADVDRIRIEAARRAAGVGQFEPDALEVELSGDASAVVEVAVVGGDAAARTTFAEDVLAPELGRVEGAGRIDTLGRAPRRVVVRPHAAALAARGLSAADVVERLRRLGLAEGAGQVRSGALVRPLVLRESVGSLDELRAVLVPTARGQVPLGDVAAVSLVTDDDAGSFRRDGEPGVLVRTWRQPSANAVSVARGVRDRVAALSQRMPGGLALVIVSDRSREIVGALAELAGAALLGMALGTLVLRFMLGRWAPTLALAVVIPASLLVAFVAFHAAGVPLDVVSLAGLALAAGMLVDNSIVVLESIETARAGGSRDPAVDGTRQVALAVLAQCATTIVVFVPLMYMQGLARAFFGEQAFAIVTSLAASLLLSMTLTPVLAGRGAAGRQRTPGREACLRLLALAWSRPVATMAAGALVALITLAGLLLLRREVLPEAPARVLVAELRLPEDLDPATAEARVLALEHVARAAVADDVVSVTSARGLPDPAVGSAGEPSPVIARLELALREGADAQRSRSSVAAALSREPDVLARVYPRRSAFVEFLGDGGGDLQVTVVASTPERAGALAARVAESVEQATGRVAVVEDHAAARASWVLRWDEQRLRAMGLTREAAESQVRMALGAKSAGRVDMAGVEPEMEVLALTPGELGVVPIAGTRPADAGAREGDRAPERTVVPLSAVATVLPEARPGRILREQARPALRLLVQGAASGRRVDALDLARFLDELPRAPDEEVELAGEGLELQRSFRELAWALALSLVLAYLLLAALYESLVLPLIIMTTVPIATGGGLGLLLITGQSLNVMSFLGLVLLGGLVVGNGIIVVQRLEEHLAAGRSHDEAARAAVSERYRPIVMTTAVAFLGMAPLALAGGEGAVLRRALATTVAGGLLTSTLASLVLVPVVHGLVTARRSRRVP